MAGPCEAFQMDPRWFSVSPGGVGASLYFNMVLELLVLLSGVKNLCICMGTVTS